MLVASGIGARLATSAMPGLPGVGSSRYSSRPSVCWATRTEVSTVHAVFGSSRRGWSGNARRRARIASTSSAGGTTPPLTEPLSLDAMLNSSGNPRIPTPAEAMRQTLTVEEVDSLTAHLRPLVEQGRGERRTAACATAVQQHSLVCLADAEDVAHLDTGESFHVAKCYNLALARRQVVEEPADARCQPGGGDAVDGLVRPVSRRSDPPFVLAEPAAVLELIIVDW